MTSNSNADLPPNKKFKHLYLGKGYDVIDLNVDDDSGSCTFKTEDGEVELNGSSQEFLDLLFSMVEIKDEGEYKYVWLDEYPVNSEQSFSNNLSLFESSEENPVQEAVEDINNGSVEIPEEFDILEGVKSIITSEFDNDSADYIVNNYHIAVAISRMKEQKISRITDQYLEKANNKIRFKSYVRKISKTLNKEYMSINPDLGLKRWQEYCQNDLLYSGEQVSSSFHINREKARRMAREDISSDGPIIELQSVEDESSIGGLEPEMGLREIAEEYVSILESIKSLLKDLLVTINTNIDRSEITSLYNIKNRLSESDYSFLTDAIEPQLRHGSSHSSIQIDESEKKVVIFDQNDSDPSIEKEMSYEEVVNTYNQVEDLASALLHVFIHAEYKIVRRFLDSEEFKYHCCLHYTTNKS